MHTVTRSFEFDYGHRVLGHQGKCRHLHGHRGKAEITIGVKELDDLGMVIDFAEIKTLLGGWIDGQWDHNLLLHPDDDQALHLCRTETRTPYLMPDCNPTAENMARVLFEEAERILPNHYQVIQVRLYETSNCYADYREER